MSLSPDPGAKADEQESAALRLTAILQGAHAGELAASIAYWGHAHSVRDPSERVEILVIRDQELEHRARVAEMLEELEAEPDPRRERWLRRIGTLISALCHVGGWFFPMYGAGRLESTNIREYEEAARFALAAGREEFVDSLLNMAEVEWDHEAYFREKIATHPLRFLIPVWKKPPPRAAIRTTFAKHRRRSQPEGDVEGVARLSERVGELPG